MLVYLEGLFTYLTQNTLQRYSTDTSNKKSVQCQIYIDVGHRHK